MSKPNNDACTIRSTIRTRAALLRIFAQHAPQIAATGAYLDDSKAHWMKTRLHANYAQMRLWPFLRLPSAGLSELLAAYARHSAGLRCATAK